MGNLRAELKQDMGTLQAGLLTRIGQTETRIAQVETKLAELESRLVKYMVWGRISLIAVFTGILAIFLKL